MARTFVFTLLMSFFSALSAAAIEVGDVVAFEHEGKQVTGTVASMNRNRTSAFVNLGAGYERPVPASVANLKLVQTDGATNAKSPDKVGDRILTIPDLAPVIPGRIVSVAPMSPPAAMQAQEIDRRLHKVSTDPIVVSSPEFSLERDRPVLLGLEPMMVATSVRSSWSKPVKQTKIDLVNSNVPNEIQTVVIEGQRVWIASADSESGRVLGVVNHPGSNAHQGVVVIDGLRDGNPQCIFTAKLSQDNGGRPLHVTSRHMINSRLFAIAYDDQVAVFDVDAKRQLWRAGAKAERIHVSPDGSVLAFSAAGQIVFVETETGKPLGGIPRPVWLGGSMAFSPDATMFAFAHAGNLWLYRIAGGELLKSISINGWLTLNTQPLVWPTNRYLVTPNGHVLDLSSGFVVWKYNGDLQSTEFSDHLNAGLVTFAKDNAVSFLRLPHREALAPPKISLNDQIVLEPPTAVQIKLDIDDRLSPNRERLLANLTQAVTRAGYKVDPNAGTTLVVALGRSPTEKLQYIVIGPENPGGHSILVNYNGIGTNAELQQNGQMIWKSSTGTGMGKPSFKPRKEPYDVSTKLDDKFLLDFQMPKRVISKEFQNGFGSNWVSVQGLK